MNPCTALVPVRNRPAAAGVSALRQALRQGALDRAIDAAALPLRFQLEALEPRRMLSAVGTIQFAGYNGYATPAAMAVTADGKIYVVSDLQASTAGGDGSDYQMRWGLARFNSDGSPDASFGPDGTGVEQFTLGSDQSYPQQLLAQDDGKLIVTGDSTRGFVIGRFNADGSVDKSFNGGLKAYDALNGYQDSVVWGRQATWITKDGHLITAGQEGDELVTLRLNADGTPDESYGPGGVARSIVTAPNSIGQGALLGVYPLNGGGAVAYVDVWAPDDAAGDGPVVPQVQRVQFDDAGQVVAQKAVDLALTNSGTWDYYLVFADDGSAFVATEDADPRIEKLTPDGDADPTFGDGGVVTLPGRYAIMDQTTADGGLFVQYGNETTMDAVNEDAQVRLAADGSVVASVNGGQPVLGGGERVSVNWGDGSILYAAEIDDASGVPTIAIERFLADGSAADSLLPADGATLAVGDRPAVYGTLGAPGAAAAAADNLRGLFNAATGATVWNPDGTQDVYA